MFKKFSWGHGVVVALLSFIAFILYMIFAFTRGYQTSELISENYYEDELAYQHVIDAKKNAESKQEQPVYRQLDDKIEIVFPESYQIDNGKVKMELFRTDDANLDVKKELELSSGNSINIPGNVLVPGSYTLKVKWTEHKKPFQIDYNLVWKLH